MHKKGLKIKLSIYFVFWELCMNYRLTNSTNTFKLILCVSFSFDKTLLQKCWFVALKVKKVVGSNANTSYLWRRENDFSEEWKCAEESYNSFFLRYYKLFLKLLWFLIYLCKSIPFIHHFYKGTHLYPPSDAVWSVQNILAHTLH